MSEQTNIEWCDSTFNPWYGCTGISPGCDNCYAEAMMDKRLHKVKWGVKQPRTRTSEAYWREPLKWEMDAAHFAHLHGRRRRVFCASLADVFDNEVPPKWRYDLFSLILSTPSIDWLILTKRIGNVKPMLAETFAGSIDQFPQDHPLSWPWPNVWLGSTIVNQEEADRDIPKLLSTPAAVRFLSMEPLLGSVNIHPWLCKYGNPEKPEQKFGIWCNPSGSIDWVIAGGESGPGARPMHPDWAHDLRDQCAAAGVPFLFKQWGGWAPTEIVAGSDLGGDMRRGKTILMHAPGNPEGFFRRGDAFVSRVGKKSSDRLIDGITHDGYPEVA